MENAPDMKDASNTNHASNSEYAVAARMDVTVAMRDGVRLAVDIYRPADPETGDPIEDPKPALLERTPYDKRDPTRVEKHGRWFARRGYVVAIQDVRGRYESEGEFYLLKNEAEDGADTVEWLAERDYCDGQVGTIGTSYAAWTQSALATQDPDGLAAMFVNQGAANGRKATLRHNGAVELRWACWALAYGGGFAKRALGDSRVQELLANVDTGELLESGPLHPGQSPLRHIPNYEEWVFDFLTTGDADSDLWQSPSLNFERFREESADVPTVYAGGWYDSYAKATCDNFVALADRKESDHFLLMGPWTHGSGEKSWGKTYSGEAEFGEAATKDYQETRLRFFEHYLKGEETWTDQPAVEYFRMGGGGGDGDSGGDSRRVQRERIFHGGEWQDADDWPLPDTEYTRFFAHADGTLARERPDADDSATTYEFDPRNPVPTIGGNCSSYVTFEQREESLFEYPLEKRHWYSVTGQGGYDQRTGEETVGASAPYGPLEQRDDILVFRTPPLESAVEIAGPIRVRVYGSTDAADTDFTAKLIEEYPPSPEFPEGFALNLSDSICRARYRGYRDHPDFVEPGEVYEFYMEPYPTANTFGAGHRIRLDISSSNYPRFDVNHNTGGPLYGDREYEVARNTVYHEKEHPTHVELPVRPRE
ncbi:CocE/NonD family hydrolase [Halorussus amylolyticus]|uniref:CocE/NonD family hydrolase n=1 Tax=Halorussus amylolyticus TaxID=1126242 RepID=UPI001EE44906|nr:CocE/NonD family hydrolase [Halorussus amylolyticus]